MWNSLKLQYDASWCALLQVPKSDGHTVRALLPVMPTNCASASQCLGCGRYPCCRILPAYQRETPIRDRITDVGTSASSGWIFCENTSLVSQVDCADGSHAEHACACRRRE